MCSWLYGFLQWMMLMYVNFVSIVSHILERNTNTYLSRSPEMEKSLNVTLTFSSLPAFISPSKKNRHTVFFGNSNGYPGELNVPLEPPVLRIRTSHSETNNTHRWEHELARFLLFFNCTKVKTYTLLYTIIESFTSQHNQYLNNTSYNKSKFKRELVFNNC